jgi:hypothetical protein
MELKMFINFADILLFIWFLAFYTALWEKKMCACRLFSFSMSSARSHGVVCDSKTTAAALTLAWHAKGNQH